MPTAWVPEQTYCRWKAQYEVCRVATRKKMKQQVNWNRKLKHVVAERTLDNRALKNVLSRNCLRVRDIGQS